jgi:hypothetical protein
MELPQNVRRFERLRYAALALSVITLPINERIPGILHRYGPAPFVLLFGLIVAVWVAFIWGIARKRQNWLRYAGLGFFLLGVLFGLPELIRGYFAEPIYWTVSIVCFVLDSAAYYFVFTGDAPAWFRRDAPQLTN